jgi:hypothetical protein
MRRTAAQSAVCFCSPRCMDSSAAARCNAHSPGSPTLDALLIPRQAAVTTAQYAAVARSRSASHAAVLQLTPSVAEGRTMKEIERLIADVENARRQFLAPLAQLSSDQAAFKVESSTWSIAEITEHLVHAESGGINLIWRAADGVARGVPVWTGDSPNRGLSIEQVVQRTWQPRERSPESALPRVGGPFRYWVAALRSCSGILAELKVALAGVPLEEVIYPHAISGPLDARQRLQFLAFHLERHRRQVASVMTDSRFPRGIVEPSPNQALDA